jgi:UDP-N-acetyl-D-mannosaminuronic acid dehydrogenase
LNKTIAVIGTGYIGLPLAILLARTGSRVIGVDLNREIVRAVNEGILASLSITEKDLKAIVEEESVKRNLIAGEEVQPADVFIVAVQTPLHPRRKAADLSHVIASVRSVLPHLKAGNLVIIESTIPPLTTREVIKPLIEANTPYTVGRDVYLAHCPERVLPGNVFHEMVNSNRVIGAEDEESCRLAKEVYASFVKGEIDIVDDVTAELVKLMENSFRDVNIALANEFSLITETLGTDVTRAIRLANKHPRVDILAPGIGVGGHCLPVDPWFITEVDPENSVLIQTARRINDGMPPHTADRIRNALAGTGNPRIVVLGVTYKPDVNDLRESPALEVVELLRKDGYDVAAYDPIAPGYGLKSIRDVASGADCLAVLVAHTAFVEELAASEDAIKAAMRTPLVLRF